MDIFPTSVDESQISSDTVVSVVFTLTVDASINSVLQVDESTMYHDASGVVYWLSVRGTLPLAVVDTANLKQFDHVLSPRNGALSAGRLTASFFSLFHEVPENRIRISSSPPKVVVASSGGFDFRHCPPERLLTLDIQTRSSVTSLIQFTSEPPDFELITPEAVVVGSLECVADEMTHDIDSNAAIIAAVGSLRSMFSMTFEYSFTISMAANVGSLESELVFDQDQDQTAIISPNVGRVTSEFFAIHRAFSFDPIARAPIAVDQEVAGRFYPFVPYQVDEDVRKNIADMFVTYPAADFDFEPPFRLTYVYGVGDADDDLTPPSGYPQGRFKYDLIVVDAIDQVVADTTTADSFDVVRWGTRLEVAQWVIGKITVKAAFHSAFASEENIESFSMYLIPENATLQSRVVEAFPDRLTSLRANLETLTSELELRAGYNVAMEIIPGSAADGERNTTIIRIHGDPGGGLGRYRECSDEIDAIVEIGGQRPDDKGRFHLNADQCLRIQPAVDVLVGENVQFKPATLELHQDACRPCCDCEDFVRLYKTISGLWERLQAAAFLAEQTRNRHRDNIERFEDVVSCKLSQPVKVRLEPFCPCCLLVTVTMCNFKGCGLFNLEATVVVNGLPPGSHFDRSSCFKNDGTSNNISPYQFGGNYPILTAIWPRLDGNQSAILRFVVRSKGCEGQTAVVHAHISVPDEGTYSDQRTAEMLAPGPSGKCDE